MHPPMPFIVGAPRSGTTLLRFMLDSHPDIAIPPETGFLAQAALKPNAGPREFVQHLESFDTWPDFHLERESLLDRLSRMPTFDLSDAYRAFYAAYAARFSKPRYGDKTPIYAFHMQKIQELFPEAAFIHIIRDGRDAALSLEKQWFSPGKGMAAQAKMWSDFVGAARASAKHVSRYLEVTIRGSRPLDGKHAIERLRVHRNQLRAHHAELL